MVLFRAFIDVDSHKVKKNGKQAFYDKKTKKAWVKRSDDAIQAQNYLETCLKVERNRQLHGETIHGDVQVTLIFYFKDYFTDKMRRSKKIPDLDNLFCLPLDALTNAGVIADDAAVCSLDGSRRKPGDTNKLEIIITSFENK